MSADPAESPGTRRPGGVVLAGCCGRSGGAPDGLRWERTSTGGCVAATSRPSAGLGRVSADGLAVPRAAAGAPAPPSRALLRLGRSAERRASSARTALGERSEQAVVMGGGGRQGTKAGGAKVMVVMGGEIDRGQKAEGAWRDGGVTPHRESLPAPTPSTDGPIIEIGLR